MSRRVRLDRPHVHWDDATLRGMGIDVERERAEQRARNAAMPKLHAVPAPRPVAPPEMKKAASELQPGDPIRSIRWDEWTVVASVEPEGDAFVRVRRADGSSTLMTADQPVTTRAKET